MPEPNRKRYWLVVVLLALILAAGALLFSDYTARKSSGSTQMANVGPESTPKSPSVETLIGTLGSVAAAQKILDQLAIKWKELGPPVVVFHRPG